ncbi:tRNA lysidine(34) synthetase TilS [Buchnera aphidicola]|uniref:tRNA lysidine(34) synthetase TilS n=1 Tax=Buchnera aphidicola TaxID=9 RepID=UPI00094C6061|nr:tRNA lysidine(34) synthetase TilS [Buchnera aphidicola]
MFIKKLIKLYPEKKNFLLALSGGVDSTVLLYQLVQIKKKIKDIFIRAIHINHNLYSQSKKFQQFCKNICIINNICIIVENIHIPQKNKYGIEGYSRKKRYELFKKNILPEETLLTAHNLNDQCENLFLSLKRSSGIRGLSGIKYCSEYQGITIIRPLIHISKKKIISWAKKNKINWIEDPSNKYNVYDRNFLRNKILSKIYKRWPNFLKNCTTSMHILTSDQKILNFFVLNFIKKNVFSDGSLSLLNFDNVIPEVRYSVLKKWLEALSKRIPSRNILKRINHEIILNKNFNNKKIIFFNYEIRRFKKTIYAFIPGDNIKNTIIPWKNIFIPLKLPNQLGFLKTKLVSPDKNKKKKKILKIPYPKKNSLISIHFQIKKKYIDKDTNKKLKIRKIWQKNSIPPWLRNKIPLLFYGQKIVAGIGLFNVNDVLKNDTSRNKKYIRITWVNPI